MARRRHSEDSDTPTPNRGTGTDRGGSPEPPEERVRRLERRLAEEVAIADVQQRLLTCVTVEQVAAVLLEVVPELTACERCRLAIRCEDGSWRCWDRTVGGPTQEYELPSEAAFAEEVAKDKRSVLAREWAPGRGPKVELATRVALRSYMAMPVTSAGRLVGLFELANFVHPEGIDEYSEVLADILVPAGASIEVALLHEEVRHRAEELSRLLRNLEDFTHAVSHDLRTPLTVVIGQAQLAQRAVESGQKDAAAQSLAAIVNSARRMNTMIEDLVDVARMEAGTIALQRQRLDLTEFTTELRDRMAGALETNRIEIVSPRKPLPMVWADPDRLERVLTNLLTNALKYSKGKVTVSFEPRDGEVVTSVADRGIGMTPDDLPHIFERYYRAKGAGKTEGLGLGLYITKLLVEAHDGRIWAESELRKGTTFHFTLPVMRP